MMSGIFVTGTDTGVGKTVVAAALLAQLRHEGVDAVPMKPVQTGCVREGADLVAPDLEYSLALTGLWPAPGERDWMCPYRYEPACSPHLAARQAGEEIQMATIETAFAELSDRHAAVVVEGAGGILVPLSRERTMLDLMARLGLPVLVVARPGLGTLNHTLLTLHELGRAGLLVTAVVLNFTTADPVGAIEADNLAMISELGGVPVIGPLPFLPDVGDTADRTLIRAWKEAVPRASALLE